MMLLRWCTLQNYCQTGKQVRCIWCSRVGLIEHKTSMRCKQCTRGFCRDRNGASCWSTHIAYGGIPPAPLKGTIKRGVKDSLIPMSYEVVWVEGNIDNRCADIQDKTINKFDILILFCWFVFVFLLLKDMLKLLDCGVVVMIIIIVHWFVSSDGFFLWEFSIWWREYMFMIYLWMLNVSW